MHDGDLTATVLVVGAGPAGLGAALALRRAGVERVTVLEREATPGGIPRHCAHPTFGIREFGRPLGGPAYAERLVARCRAAGVEILTDHGVAAIEPGGELVLTTPEGVRRARAARVVLATGVREASRAARLVGGTRPLGVMTTGAFQRMVHGEGLVPFRRPLLVGSELVAFSALLTARHAGIRPVAMIEAGSRVVARHPAGWLARLMGVPLLTRTGLAAIHGGARVDGVRLRGDDGAERDLACDGVLFTGAFLPEASLAACGHLALAPGSGGPAVDQFARTADPAFLAAGNLLRPVETAGWCHREGAAIGAALGHDLAHDVSGGLPGGPVVPVIVQGAVKLVVPQRLVLDRSGAVAGPAPLDALQIRMAEAADGVLEVRQGDTPLYRRSGRFLPERRILVPLADLKPVGTEPLTVLVRPAGKGGRPT